MVHEYYLQSRNMVWIVSLLSERLKGDSRGFCGGRKTKETWLEMNDGGDWQDGLLGWVVRCLVLSVW